MQNHQELSELIGKKDYVRALEIAKSIRVNFPDRFVTASYNLAHVQSLLGLTDAVITTLEEAYERGAWWLEEEFDEFPIFESLKENSRFRNLIKKYHERFNKEKRKSKIKWTVYTPLNYDSDNSYPLLFALHWRGSNMDRFAPYWKGGVTSAGVILVVPQSSQLIEPDGYTWHNISLGLDELEQVYNSVVSEFNVDRNRVLMGGASIGGKLALEASLASQRFPIKGVVSVIPHGIDVKKLAGKMEHLSIDNFRCCIITNSKDSSYEACRELVNQFQKHGMSHLLVESEDQGHIIPLNFSHILSRIIPFLLEIDDC